MFSALAQRPERGLLNFPALQRLQGGDSQLCWTILQGCSRASAKHCWTAGPGALLVPTPAVCLSGSRLHRRPVGAGLRAPAHAGRSFMPLRFLPITTGPLPKQQALPPSLLPRQALAVHSGTGPATPVLWASSPTPLRGRFPASTPPAAGASRTWPGASRLVHYECAIIQYSSLLFDSYIAFARLTAVIACSCQLTKQI